MIPFQQLNTAILQTLYLSLSLSPSLSPHIHCINRLSLHLLEAYLLDEARKPAVSILNKQLVANQVPVSAHTLERVLLLCIKQYKLSQAIGTFNCMTRRCGIAPSKEVYTEFTRLLAATSRSDLMSEKLCYRILAGMIIPLLK
jgi:hypothetical protein